jgi:hypothetical protein
MWAFLDETCLEQPFPVALNWRVSRKDRPLAEEQLGTLGEKLETPMLQAPGIASLFVRRLGRIEPVQGAPWMTLGGLQ